MTKTALRTYTGAVSVVTGAASGIGRALAEELSRRGSEVVLADLQIELAEEVAATLRAAGGKAQAALLDVADAAAVDALLRATVERAGRLDYLFNNAGIGVGGPVGKHTLEDWNHILDVNLRGVIHGVHSAYPIMQRQGFGHIVNTASVAGLAATAGTVAYCATKYAVVGLSTALRDEIAAEGIRVSALCPGLIRTPILTGGKYGKIYLDTPPEERLRLLERANIMPPDQFACKALNAVAKNKGIIIIPAWWRLLVWLTHHTPKLIMQTLSKIVQDSARKA